MRKKDLLVKLLVKKTIKLQSLAQIQKKIMLMDPLTLKIKKLQEVMKECQMD